MRNLKQYPITLDEMIQAVEREAIRHEMALQEMAPRHRPIGDIHGLALITRSEVCASFHAVP